MNQLLSILLLLCIAALLVWVLLRPFPPAILNLFSRLICDAVCQIVSPRM